VPRLARAVPTVAVLAATAALPGAAARAATTPPGFVLTTHQAGGKGFAPAFIGNGYLAGRQPALGQGFARVPLKGGKLLATQSEVQGFYAKTTKKDEGLIERRAALPTWSTLTYDDGSGALIPGRGRLRGYRQALDLRTGTLTTSFTWVSRAGRSTAVRYEVVTDRARPHAALVRLRITPRFSGRVSVTDLIEGRGAEHTAPAGTGHAAAAARQWVDVRTLGLPVRATVASVLDAPGGAATRAVTRRDRQTAAQRATLRVRSGRSYTFTKAVGVAVSTDAGAHAGRPTPHARALAAAAGEARRGYARARRGSDAAWARLWASDIQVEGDARLQGQVRSALFALLASVRDDTPWAPSPGGLSSDGYNGHVFWDSETWMYPSLLATAPALARQMLQYRVDRLGAARAYARVGGFSGARFPWESALSGAEETPSCCNTGKYEIHVSADVALAMWQYWLASGDRSWLARRAWPVVAGIADYWVSRSHPNPDGTRSIDGVIGPDEYHEKVDDSIYTNVAARDTLRIARSIAGLTGHPAPGRWEQTAAALRILPANPITNVQPEFQDYRGDTIKQADVALLAYPWENPQPDAVTQADLDYYVPRTDPDGPSMTDGIHALLSSQLNTPGCAAFTFTKRSVDPFMRGPYEQFSEARTGGAFTFTTGAGGFLQEFLYGYSGMRWRGDRVHLDPSLPPQLTGVTLRAVHWRGRTLRVRIARQSTTVQLLAGKALQLEAPGGSVTLPAGATARLPTRRPDEAPTDDVARCRPVTATPATAEPPQAAVDGTPTTSWLAEKPGTRVQVDLGAPVALGSIAIARPPVLAIATGKTDVDNHAKTGPTRSASETVEVSADGGTWQTLARVAAPPITEELAGAGQPVRYVRVTAGADASAKHPLVMGELSVRARASG
jgi:trehalose/maltose hydrolase-like predicted phosphorylase